MIANATVVLPQPDSPTRPTHSPCCRDSETSTTAGTAPAPVLEETCNPSTVSRGVSSMRVCEKNSLELVSCPMSASIVHRVVAVPGETAADTTPHDGGRVPLGCLL